MWMAHFKELFLNQFTGLLNMILADISCIGTRCMVQDKT